MRNGKWSSPTAGHDHQFSQAWHTRATLACLFRFVWKACPILWSGNRQIYFRNLSSSQKCLRDQPCSNSKLYVKHIWAVLHLFMYYCCRGSSMTDVVNKFEYPRNLKLYDDLFRSFFHSQLRVCSDLMRCWKFMPKHHQYSLTMYKVLY